MGSVTPITNHLSSLSKRCASSKECAFYWGVTGLPCVIPATIICPIWLHLTSVVLWKPSQRLNTWVSTPARSMNWWSLVGGEAKNVFQTDEGWLNLSMYSLKFFLTSQFYVLFKFQLIFTLSNRETNCVISKYPDWRWQAQQCLGPLSLWGGNNGSIHSASTCLWIFFISFSLDYFVIYQNMAQNGRGKNLLEQRANKYYAWLAL